MICCTLLVIDSNSSVIAMMVLLIKLVPWSLINILGHPNMVINFSNKKCVDVSTLQSLNGASFSHLVKYSATIMIYLATEIFAGESIGPTNSIYHFSNTCRVNCGLRGISSLFLGFLTLSQTSEF